LTNSVDQTNSQSFLKVFFPLGGGEEKTKKMLVKNSFSCDIPTFAVVDSFATKIPNLSHLGTQAMYKKYFN
jgi:hypothetical protein